MAGELTGLMYGLSLNQSTLPDGMQLGDKITQFDFSRNGFKECILVRANPSGGTISANAALKYITNGTTGLGVVDMVAAAGDYCAGVNDVSGESPTVNVGTGVTIAAANYFFMTMRGSIRPLLDATVAVGPLQTGSATAGQLQAWATTAGATFQQTNLESLVASGAGGVTNCFKD